ncbi:MAG TPA: hypothetical protein VNO31_51660 [Umezawaea sp.]|nr:hypothetical protein [Umezawaea sp.]
MSGLEASWMGVADALRSRWLEASGLSGLEASLSGAPETSRSSESETPTFRSDVSWPP